MAKRRLRQSLEERFDRSWWPVGAVSILVLSAIIYAIVAYFGVWLP